MVHLLMTELILNGSYPISAQILDLRAPIATSGVAQTALPTLLILQPITHQGVLRLVIHSFLILFIIVGAYCRICTAVLAADHVFAGLEVSAQILTPLLLIPRNACVQNAKPGRQGLESHRPNMSTMKESTKYAVNLVVDIVILPKSNVPNDHQLFVLISAVLNQT